MSSAVLAVESLASTERRAEMWTLQRPAVRNALDPALVAALRGALTKAEAGDVQLVVLRGAGASFCAGADLRFLQSHSPAGSASPRAFLSDIWDLTTAMERSAIVFVAALHGHAVAGGMELALACDVVLAEEGTLIGDGHVRNNLVPGGGASARMERALGKSTALWLGLSGALLEAQDPSLAGWIREVVAPGAAVSRAAELAGQLLAVPDAARRRYKRLLHAVASPLAEQDKTRELDVFDTHWDDQDVPQALCRFLATNRKATS